MDDELRRRARAARAEVEAQVDVEYELAGRPNRPTSGVTPITPVAPRGRMVAVAGSIAAVAVAIVGGAVLFSGPDSIETSEPSTPIVATSDDSPSVVPTTTGPAPTTTVVPTSLPGTTTATTPATTAAVSYLDPPPMVALSPLGVVPVPVPTEGGYEVAIGDLGVAVASWPDDSNSGRVDLIGFDGSTRAVANLPTNGAIAYGPGDVLYSTLQGESIEDFAVVAMPLSGGRVGEIVASEPAGVNQYLEYPAASFGHGSGGVTLRRYDVGEVGQVGIDYVDVDGDPTTLGLEPTSYDIDRDLLAEIPRSGFRSGVVTSSDGDTWSLAVDKHPDAAETYVGPSPVAPTSNGDGVLWTHVGPDIAAEQDFGVGSQWVIAQLRPGGSVTWWSLPDGWTVAASDIWGTVAVRQQGEQLEVAVVDFTPDETPAPTTPTTVPDDAVSWRSLPWEDAGFERACSGIEFEGCTQLLVDRDGSTVSHDPTTAQLTRHSTPPIVTTLPDSVTFGSFLWHLGPDGVVYLGVPGDPESERGVDVVAVTLAPGDAGREIARWPDLDEVSGDSELVVTRHGLVDSDCCGPDMERPDPEARVLVPWLDRDGQETSIEAPVIRVEVDVPRLTIHRDDGATRSWTVEPSGDWQPRGMPSVLPTFDGGFVATTSGSGGQTIIRGWEDGTVDMVTIEQEPDGTVPVPTLDANGRATVADGDRFARFEPFADRAEFWAGQLEYGDDGSVTLPDIDALIDGGAAWAGDPVAFGNAVAGRPAVNERRTIELDRRSDSAFLVSVTTSNLFDDSVSAIRLELDLIRNDDGVFRFESGRQSHACQPDRGHQDFTAEPCI